jgi:dipeptidase D
MEMTPDAQLRIVDALYGSPDGVLRMSDNVPGLIETSTNLGDVSAAKGTFSAGFLVRSAVNSARDDVQGMAASVFELAGIDTVRKDAFTGWKPNPDSPLLSLMQSVYRDHWGHDAEVVALHAGLETSEFGATYPGLNMISVGPTIEHPHSPDERLEIASVGKVYDLLVATLQRIPAPSNHSSS